MHSNNVPTSWLRESEAFSGIDVFFHGCIKCPNMGPRKKMFCSLGNLLKKQNKTKTKKFNQGNLLCHVNYELWGRGNGRKLLVSSTQSSDLSEMFFNFSFSLKPWCGFYLPTRMSQGSWSSGYGRNRETLG